METLDNNAEFFVQVFGEEVLKGIDLQLFLNSFKNAAGFETDDSDLAEAQVFGLPFTKQGKKGYVAGFAIYTPTRVDKIHYLQFWNIIEKKAILFDAGITDVKEIVEIGKFLSTKEATKLQRLTNYFLAALVAYLTGRKFVFVGTFYRGSSYEAQLRRICPNELYKGEIQLQNGEKRPYVVLYNTRRRVIKSLLNAAWVDFMALFKQNLKAKIGVLF
jgi:hypothetical protein